MAGQVGVFDIFKIGIGPSSSHTVGPMRAARRFVGELAACGLLQRAARVETSLYGSLGATGRGHGTDVAVMLGLAGHEPDRVDPDVIPAHLAAVAASGALTLCDGPSIGFDREADIRFERKVRLPIHSNGMRFTAYDASAATLLERVYFSIGGGFIVDAEGRPLASASADGVKKDAPIPYPFASGDELLAQCQASGLSVSTLMLANESASRPEAEVRSGILHLADVMEACVKRGCEREGILPGKLAVRRRAALMRRQLEADPSRRIGAMTDPLGVIDWVDLFALAVNEENAAGGRVVTAPTNGAAGIVPAVLLYYVRFLLRGAQNQPGVPDDVRADGVVRFLLTAAAIGSLYQRNASISGAEVGCQGEVGVACSMAAAGLAEVMGGTPEQVENAAEIGMEHNLGLTCDPIGGLVQVPCIERNAMGAVKAINAARLAMSGDGSHKVSLDKVIRTMRATGRDMNTKYKETSQGGLAVNIPEC
ncbi:MAG: L-serine ammonia-lyase [Myxococcota bacterium]